MTVRDCACVYFRTPGNNASSSPMPPLLPQMLVLYVLIGFEYSLTRIPGMDVERALACIRGAAKARDETAASAAIPAWSQLTVLDQLHAAVNHYYASMHSDRARSAALTDTDVEDMFLALLLRLLNDVPVLATGADDHGASTWRNDSLVFQKLGHATLLPTEGDGHTLEDILCPLRTAQRIVTRVFPATNALNAALLTSLQALYNRTTTAVLPTRLLIGTQDAATCPLQTVRHAHQRFRQLTADAQVLLGDGRPPTATADHAHADAADAVHLAWTPEAALPDAANGQWYRLAVVKSDDTAGDGVHMVLPVVRCQTNLVRRLLGFEGQPSPLELPAGGGAAAAGAAVDASTAVRFVNNPTAPHQVISLCMRYPKKAEVTEGQFDADLLANLRADASSEVVFSCTCHALVQHHDVPCCMNWPFALLVPSIAVHACCPLQTRCSTASAPALSATPSQTPSRVARRSGTE